MSRERRQPFERSEFELEKLSRLVRTWGGVTDARVETVTFPPFGPFAGLCRPTETTALQMVIETSSYRRLHEVWAQAAGIINRGDYGFTANGAEDGPHRIRFFVDCAPQGF
jgi:hypothetical protein